MSGFVVNFGSATGAVGPAGATGAQGSQASPGVNIFNNGATLGTFPTFNFQGGINGTTGPNNTVNVNSIPDFAQVGITGLGVSGSNVVASGTTVKWNTEIARLGTIGHTNVGTAAGIITINKSAYYQINSKMNFTGLPSGVVVQAQQFISATGAAFGAGGGTPIAQSVAYLQPGLGASGAVSAGQPNSLDASYIVYIPSGTSIETYVTYLNAGGGSAVYLAPTGTFFDIRNIGN